MHRPIDSSCSWVCVIQFHTGCDTISLLIDKGESTSSKPNSNNAPTGNSTKYATMSETMYFHQAMQAFWLGHTERCQYFVGNGLGSFSF
mgnify:CR=1 FL=1